jgi:ribosomal protein L37AE/L43A
MPKRYEYLKKPAKCPECGSTHVAKILYGLPTFSEKLEAEMKAGRITLGGCCVTNDDPVWQCADCNVIIYKKS